MPPDDKPPGSSPPPAAAYGWANGIPVTYPTASSPPLPRLSPLPPALAALPSSSSASVHKPPSAVAFPKAFDPDRALLYQRAMSRALPGRSWQAKLVSLAVWLGSACASHPSLFLLASSPSPSSPAQAHRLTPSSFALARSNPPEDVTYRLFLVEDYGTNMVVGASVRPPLLPQLPPLSLTDPPPLPLDSGAKPDSSASPSRGPSRPPSKPSGTGPGPRTPRPSRTSSSRSAPNTSSGRRSSRR